MGPLCCILWAKNTVSTPDDGKREAKRCNIWLEFFNHPFNAKQKPGMERDNQRTYANRDVLLHHLCLNFDRVWQPVDVCQLRRLAAPPLLWNPRANPETAFELTTMFAEGVCWQKWGSLLTWIIIITPFHYDFSLCLFSLSRSPCQAIWGGVLTELVPQAETGSGPHIHKLVSHLGLVLSIVKLLPHCFLLWKPAPVSWYRWFVFLFICLLFLCSYFVYK